jgi:hypothetical protein
MDWKKGIVDGLKLVGVMGVLVIGVMLALIVALIITGIMNDTVVPALNLSNDTTNNITAVYSFRLHSEPKQRTRNCWSISTNCYRYCSLWRTRLLRLPYS